MNKNFKNITKDLKNSLDKDRYEHTIGVSYTAICLAMKYDVDLEKAEIAGLLHDCAKCIADDKKLKKCIEHNISINEAEKAKPSLLHAKLGAFIAMDKYGIQDKEIINAILKHTTGSQEMTMLEKIIFVADYIEPGRDKQPRLDVIRYTAFNDLDLCVYLILEDSVNYLNSNPDMVDPTTIETFEYYKKYMEER